MIQTSGQNQGFLYTFPRNCFGREDENIGKSKKKKELILTLIADDHPYLITGVESDLNKDPKIKIVGTADSYDSLIVKAEEIKPDVILLDLRMPGFDSYDLKDYVALLKERSNAKIIVFSNETGWARIHRCLDIGASAYIEKAISLGKLGELIHRVCCEDEILIYTAEQLPQIQFSPRQKEILHLIMDGKENDDISQILRIELKTVQSYVNEIKIKLSDAFGIHPIRPRTLILLASKLGFGHKLV